MTHPTPTHPTSPTPPPRDERPFRPGDLVSIVDDRPGATVWTITEIVADHPQHDGPFARLTAVDDSGDSWSALRILRHVEPGTPPRLGEIIRDAERILAQALGVLGRDYDPASAPVGPVWSGVELRSHVVMLRLATSDVARALKLLRSVADLPLPPVGSAVHVPTGAGYGTGGESPARSGGPGTTVAVECCGGKSLNGGIAAVCGRRVTHYPHRLDREPGAL